VAAVEPQLLPAAAALPLLLLLAVVLLQPLVVALLPLTLSK
jgi:hypothetical protein